MFIKRITYSQEYLDLGDVEAGLNKKLAQENAFHKHLIVEAFDIVEDKAARDKLFEDVIR